ncbi:MAG TPA: hydroxymethylbilane synthase [Propionibacteriaceae bacterium]|nr:hydroxymethylbilane synthase [Propionibacteriaceae bacterium]
MVITELRIGARKSPLARAQADVVAELLAAHGVRSTFVGITTAGDVDSRQLTEIGGTGVFATAVRGALRDRSVDLAVHSLKDLPTLQPDDLEIIAIPEREDSRDVLIGCRLDELEDGSRVGTGAPRRALQMLDWARRRGIRLEIVPVRGNVGTRLDLVATAQVTAVLLAAAGLRRLGYASLEESDNSDIVVRGLPAQVLSPAEMLPAPGQGALALEVSRGLSPDLRTAVATLDHPHSRAESLAERGFLAALEAGCTAPVGARAVVKSVRDTSVDLTLAAVIGRTLSSSLSEPAKSPPLRLEVRGSTSDPAAYGAATGRSVLAELRDLQRSRRPGAEAEQ